MSSPDGPVTADDGRAGPRVLVGYASAAGSTRGIAERIADELRTDLQHRTPAAEVLAAPVGPDVKPGGFDALIVGSAVHDMAWLPEATAFLRRAAATGAPAWVFTVGGIEPRGRITRLLVAHERSRVERAFPPAFAPRDHQVFGGVVVMTGVPMWGRLFWRLCGGRPGDHRNWPRIDGWAAAIANELAADSTASTGVTGMNSV